MNSKERLLQYSLSLFFLLYLAYKIRERVLFVKSISYPLTFLEWASWILVMLTFLIFALIYLMRGKAKARAKGFWEGVFPIFSIFLPVLIYESVHFISYFPWLLKPLLRVTFSSRLYESGMIIIFAGNIVNIWSLSYLRDAFSILVQARKVVSQGPYRYVRHPLYVGEFLATLGFVMIAPSILNLSLFLIFVLFQNERAKLEEQKLLATFPAYREYQQKTGRYLPIRHAFK